MGPNGPPALLSDPMKAGDGTLVRGLRIPGWFYSASMKAAAAVAVLCVLVGVLAATAAGHAGVSPLASVRVVGSGPLTWAKVGVRAAPDRSARVLATLEQFRPDFHPRTVLVLSARLGRNGEPKWYRIAVPRASERQNRLDPGRGRRASLPSTVGS